MNESGRPPVEQVPGSGGSDSAGCMGSAVITVGVLFTAVSGACVGNAALHELGRMIGGHGNLEEFVVVAIVALVTTGLGIGMVWLGIKLTRR